MMDPLIAYVGYLVAAAIAVVIYLILTKLRKSRQAKLQEAIQ